MLFNPNTRIKKAAATVLAVGVLGGGAAGLATAGNGPAPKPPPVAAKSAVASSNVPTSLKRAETAAEDVIGFLEKGKPAKSRAEAKLLKQLAHGKVSRELRAAGVPDRKVRALQVRADRLAALSRSGAPKLSLSLAANHVSQLMPGLYARYHDPVPAAVLKLDYLDREIQLRSMAGQQPRVTAAVKDLGASWSKLRPQLVKAGGVKVARQYDAHVRALHVQVQKLNPRPAALQKEAVHGLDVVDLMEGAFLGK